MDIEKIIIVDFGGVDTQRAAKLIRKNSVYAEIFSSKKAIENIDKSVKGIILTGEVKEKSKDIYETLKKTENSVLDMTGERIDDKKVLDFINSIEMEKNWNTEFLRDFSIREIKEKVGDKKVLLALSGGVDSSVCAKLISEAVGNQLTCIFVDHGLMRKNEGEMVKAAFENSNINLIAIDAEERFLNRLKGVTDPEQKRKIIGEEFIRVFEEEAKKIGAVDFLAQGTIYPDIVESDDENLIKSHHNVGGLPDTIEFKDLIEPLKFLFKDEVRELGTLLGMDEKYVSRQPFPGPGLAVRCLGEITKEKLDILRDADAIFRDEIYKEGLYKDIAQYFAIITNSKSTGNKNNKRSYEYTIALRAVITKDFMTAEFAEIPFTILRKISKRITDEIDIVSRVVYDITDKPPATVEWE